MGQKYEQREDGERSEVGFEPKAWVSNLIFLSLHITFFAHSPSTLLLALWASCFHFSLSGICQLWRVPPVCTRSNLVLPGPTVLTSLVSRMFLLPGPT